MAENNKFDIQCVYPQCRRVFTIPFRPVVGQELYRPVCQEPFLYYPGNQGRPAISRRIRHQTIQPQSSVLDFDNRYWQSWHRLSKIIRNIKPVSWALIIGFAGIVAMVTIVSLTITNGQTEQDIETEQNQRNRPTAISNRPTAIPNPSTPTLREYWDLPACFDLFDRIRIAQLAGMSDEAITSSLAQADGAVKRYGMSRVLNHCYDAYGDDYE